jgi:hypothetical protein
MTSDRYKCRLCDFTTPKMRTLKSGKVVSGWIAMQHHVNLEHAESLDQEVDLVGEWDRE